MKNISAILSRIYTSNEIFEIFLNLPQNRHKFSFFFFFLSSIGMK